MVTVSIISGILLWGLMSQSGPSVEISSIEKKTMVYSGYNHQIFTGFVVNKGNVEAVNVRVYVNWLDVNNGEHEGFCDVGVVGVGESVSFSIDFPLKDLVLVSYFTQWVTFE